MPLKEGELKKRDSTRNIGDDLLQAIHEVKVGNYSAEYSATPNQIVQTRPKCDLSHT